MLDPLSFVITMLTALPIAIAVGLSAQKNNYWSTADFLPLVFWFFLGTFLGIAIEELIKYIYRVDNETLRSLTGIVGAIISGCGIYWYRNRKTK